MTGAPIPDGADAIVPVERTERDCASAVLVLAPAAVGDHIRPAGGDVRRGATVFTPGEVLGPAAIGVLASLARTEEIYKGEKFSDHAPLTIAYDGLL